MDVNAYNYMEGNAISEFSVSYQIVTTSSTGLQDKIVNFFYFIISQQYQLGSYNFHFMDKAWSK